MGFVRAASLILVIGTGCGPGSDAARSMPARATPAPPVPRETTSPPVAVDVCVGSAHACALDAAGNVHCWGDNERHQIDTTTVPERESPVRIEGLPPTRKIACGSTRTCALARDGSVACWGDSIEGLAKVEGVTGALDLSLLSRGVCVLVSGGEIACWDERRPARVLEGIEGVTSLGVTSLGASKLCALRASAEPVCFDVIFRDDAPKMKGAGAPPPPPPPSPRAASIESPSTLGTALDAAVLDDGRVCGALADRPVECSRGSVQPFEGAAMRSFSSANAMGGCGVSLDGRAACGGHVMADDIVVARQSGDFGCGTTRSGGIACWGRASFGQLGDGTHYLVGVPRRVPDVDDAVSLSVAKGAACVARKSGKLTCWGRILEADAPDAPHDIPTAEPVSEVVIGDPLDASRLCARGASGWKCRHGDWIAVPEGKGPWVGPPKPRLVDDAGRTWDWAPWSKAPEPAFFARVGLRMKHLSRDGYCGVDDRGRLVCGHCGACTDPKAVLSIVGADGFTEAASLTEDSKGRTLACGIRRGQPSCHSVDGVPWSKVEAPPSVELEGGAALGDAVHIVSSGGRYEANASYALFAGGVLGSWGDGRYLQRGSVTASEQTITAISDLPPVVEVGTGGSFACARTEAGLVYCWGSNREGGVPGGDALERPKGVRFRLP